MCVAGKLRRGDIAALLQLLGRGKMNGALSVRSKGGRAKLIFVDGRIMSASMTNASSLGQALVSRGVLESSELSGALGAQSGSRRGRRLGAILVELALAERGDIGVALDDQIREIVAALTAWSEVRYDFEPQSVPEVDPSFGGVDVDSLFASLQPS
jgi:hypothetical protein